MDAHTRAAVALLVGLLPTAAVAESAGRSAAVAIRVYDTAGLSEADLQPALAAAAGTLLEAQVAAVWHLCAHEAGSSEGDPVCREPLGPGELVVRIVRSDPGVSAAFTALGDAFVDPQARTGVLATIYADHVQRTAQDVGIDARALLGRALAHEIGHLLLATTAHAPGGLMRAAWLRHELRRDQRADWSFGPDEVTRIRERIALTPRPFPGAGHRPE